jgi:hypothetical protein
MMYRLAAALCALTIAGVPAGAQTLSDALLGGRPTADIRLRYESVSDKGRPQTGAGATLRTRLGYDTAAWNGLTLATAFDILVPVGDTAYNTTRNGKTLYPNIGDTPLVALKHLNLSYAGFDSRITVGRQRLALVNQRFLASPDWRMHGQSFDAVQLVNNSVDGLALTYIWINRVNRIYGESLPFDPTSNAAATNQASHYNSDSHVLGATYTAIPGLKLDAYALLLDLDPPDYARRPAQLVAASRLDAATVGARAEYTARLGDVGLTLIGDYARQSPYADNALSFGLDYWLGEAGLSWNGFTASVIYEVLSGNGTIAVDTPIGWLHNNNGLADFFSTTPVNGVRDFYFRGSHAWPGFLGLRAMNTQVQYHDYRTDRLDRGIGSEWSAFAEFQVDPGFSLLLKYANYQGSGIGFGGATDKSVFWLQTAWRY